MRLIVHKRSDINSTCHRLSSALNTPVPSHQEAGRSALPRFYVLLCNQHFFCVPSRTKQCHVEKWVEATDTHPRYTWHLVAVCWFLFVRVNGSACSVVGKFSSCFVFQCWGSTAYCLLLCSQSLRWTRHHLTEKWLSRLLCSRRQVHTVTQSHVSDTSAWPALKLCGFLSRSAI